MHTRKSHTTRQVFLVSVPIQNEIKKRFFIFYIYIYIYIYIYDDSISVIKKISVDII